MKIMLPFNRALSMETGGSIENILESIGASTDSLASVIPMEKREQLANFEMNLKQMIEEAKQLADQSPGNLPFYGIDEIFLKFCAQSIHCYRRLI